MRHAIKIRVISPASVNTGESGCPIASGREKETVRPLLVG